MAPGERRIAHERIDVPGERDAALVEHDDIVYELVRDAEVLLDEQNGGDLGGAAQRFDDVPHDQRSEPFGRLVDEQDLVVVEQRATQRDHLLLPAGKRPGFLCAACFELGEQLVDEIVAQGCSGTLGEAQVLVDRQAREHVAVFRDVADAAPHDLVHGQPGRLVAGEQYASGPRHQSQDAPQRRRLAHAVATEQPGDPAPPDVERHALQDVRLADVHVEIAHLEQHPGAVHNGSPRYADCTTSLAMMRSGVSMASSEP